DVVLDGLRGGDAIANLGYVDYPVSLLWSGRLQPRDRTEGRRSADSGTMHSRANERGPTVRPDPSRDSRSRLALSDRATTGEARLVGAARLSVVVRHGHLPAELRQAAGDVELPGQTIVAGAHGATQNSTHRIGGQR